MGSAPYHHRYQRARPGGGPPAAGYLPNPACHWTDQGADPDALDLAWRIRREWRVIYYSARRAAGLSLWTGVDDFEAVMTDILCRLSSGFKPIEPVRSREGTVPKDEPIDRREERIFQPSCRVYRAPVFDPRKRTD
jgi:hypothetical protein